MPNLIMKHNSIRDLQEKINQEIENYEKEIKKISDMLGEKIRINQEHDQSDSEFVEFKEKLQGSQDKEKKKKNNKKKSNSKWYNLDGIYVYDGFGINGELELYFKYMEELKSEHAELQKRKKTLDSIIDKGLKEDIGCISLLKNGFLEIAFSKNIKKREKFSFKSIYQVKPENNINSLKMELM